VYGLNQYITALDITVIFTLVTSYAVTT
jgi:hypothetical protein